MKNNSILVLDSGIGGVSTLNTLREVLPNESFIFYADHKNSPYGNKDIKEVRNIVFEIINKFIKEKNIKAVVLACNSATSAAAKYLRKNLDIAVLGLEPALKPALEKSKKDVIVIGTELTIKGKKFFNLLNNLKKIYNKKILSIPAPKLASLVEQNNKQDIEDYLNDLFIDINLDNYSSLVLGCTHYVLIKNEINNVLSKYNEKIELIDGNLGVSLNLKNILIKSNLLSCNKNPNLEIISSGNKKSLELIYNYLV